MIGHFGRTRDPFEGKGARRTQRRFRIEGLIAITMAIVACGVIAALWLMTLAPLAKTSAWADPGGQAPNSVSFTTRADLSYVRQTPTCFPRSNWPVRMTLPSVRYHDHAP